MATTVLVVALWWNAASTNDPIGQHRDSNLTSSAPAVTITPIPASAPVTSSDDPSAVQPADINARAAVAHPKPPPGDLLAAIKYAQEERGNPTITPPVGQSSWQGLSPKDAAKVLEEAVKATFAPSASSAVSPFRNDKPVN